MNKATSCAGKTYDLVVIGGGINGVACARDAAGRGLNVLLIEKSDLASHTSSSSSKLIHGGLRYLAQYHFKLVFEALKERRLLHKNASYMVHPLEFIYPTHGGYLHQKYVHIGMKLYDLFSLSDSLPSSRALKGSQLGPHLKAQYKYGFSYYDCQTDDARLVITVAKDAHQKGATLLTRTSFLQAKRLRDHWQCQIQSRYDKQPINVNCKAIINAAGPFANDVVDTLGQKTPYRLSFVKGSHIVIPNHLNLNHAYILEQPDKRVVFITPYENHFLMIGTTDVSLPTKQEHYHIAPDETEYLVQSYNRYFQQSIQRQHIIHSWAGVRPLIDSQNNSASTLSRDFKIECQSNQQNELPLLNIWGGKLTAHRLVAERCMHELKPYFSSMRLDWTENAFLPGANAHSTDENINTLHKQFSWLPLPLIKTYYLRYGMDTCTVLQGCHTIKDLGPEFDHGLYAKEVAYMVKHEWARTTEDILWRRSKLGLIIEPEAARALKDYLGTLT